MNFLIFTGEEIKYKLMGRKLENNQIEKVIFIL